MKEVGTRKEVLCNKAIRTAKGFNKESLVATDRKFASTAKRSESAQKSPWRAHVISYSKKNKVSYSAALADPNCKSGYTKSVKPKTKPKKASP